MKRLLLALAFLTLSAGAAQAETCTFPAGSTDWSGVTANIDATCTEDATDTFVIPAGATVTTTGSIAFSTGDISITGGTLIHSCGTNITWSGATTGGIAVNGTGATYQPQGCVLWTGRITSNVTYAAGPPVTAAFTLPIADISTVASASTDFIVFGDDDPADPTVPITTPVQIGPGVPTPGYHRPSFRKWAWHQIQSAPASSTLTIYQRDVTDAEGLAPSAYDGTYGPLLVADTAITGAPTRMTYGSGVYSRIVYGNITGIDGDGSAQYVEFRTGTCADQMAKIMWIDDEGGGAGVDWVYVAGDVSDCGSGVDTRINYGIRKGDRVRLVRPALVQGTNATAGPSVFVTNGGVIKADYARFEYLDDATSYSGGSTFGFRCNLCLFRTTTDPGLSTSYITNSDFAFMQDGGATDTAAIGGVNSNSSINGYFAGTTPIDATGFVLNRNYIHDQPAVAASAGVAGIRFDAFRNLNILRTRVERTGDDAVSAFVSSFGGATEYAHNNTIRHIIAGEILETATAHSASCFDGGSYVESGSATAATLHRYIMSDLLLIGCADGALASNTLGSTYNRLLMGGIQSTNEVFNVGGMVGYTSIPVATLASIPNITSNAVAFLGGTATGAGTMAINGILKDSIVAGNNQTTNRAMRQLVRLENSLVNRGASGGDMMERLTTNVGHRFPLTTLINSVLVNAATNTYNLTANYANGSYFTGLSINRLYVANERVSTNGLFDEMTGTDTTQPLNVDGMTVSVTTQTTGGLGRGSSNQGTGQGSRIANACIEGTTGRTDIRMFGANATATSFKVTDGQADGTDDHNLAAFVASPDASSICSGAARPTQIGLSEFGVVHGLAGDAFTRNVERVTTNTRLIRTIGGVGSAPNGPNIR